MAGFQGFVSLALQSCCCGEECLGVCVRAGIVDIVLVAVSIGLVEGCGDSYGDQLFEDRLEVFERSIVERIDGLGAL